MAYARTCHTQFPLPRAAPSIKNPKSTGDQTWAHLEVPEENPPRRRHCKPPPMRFPWRYKPVSVMAVFRCMDHVPSQRGHIDEGVWFVMRGDVVNSILTEIRRPYRYIPRRTYQRARDGLRRPCYQPQQTCHSSHICWVKSQLSSVIASQGVLRRTCRQAWWRSDQASSQ